MANQLQNKTESQPWSDEDLRDLHRSGLSRHLVSTYGWKSRIARTAALKLAARFERGHLYSFTLREILNRYYGVHVGAYSYGACLVPGTIPPGVTIGRYCSIAHGLRAFVRDHPYDWLSMHPFFYNKECGIVAQDTLAPGTLEIGHDTWIGANVVITPNCDRIGLGAVVGAGAIVTKNVPDFAIVAGNPAKVLRQRFSDELCETIRQSRWWNLPISACKKFVSEMTRPLHELGEDHPLLHCNTHSSETGSTLKPA